MIYPTIPNYIITGFSPPSEGMEMGGYGFSVGLKASFAKRCLKHKIKQENIDRINEFGNAMAKRIFRNTYFRPPFNFREDNKKSYTILLAWAQVEGNACDLGLSGEDYGRIMKMKDDSFVEYHPHNVDSVRQAYALLSLWLKWYDVAFSCVMDKSEI